MGHLKRSGSFSDADDAQDELYSHPIHSSLASCNVQSHRAVKPPSMVRVVPVMNDDSSDARKAAAAATSDTCPMR